MSDIHKEGCKLKWKKPLDDGGEPIDGYLVEKFDPDTGIWLPVGKSDIPEMTVDGLTPGHEYKFRVKALNKEGESEPLETFGTIVAKDPFSKRLFAFKIAQIVSNDIFHSQLLHRVQALPKHPTGQPIMLTWFGKNQLPMEDPPLLDILSKRKINTAPCGKRLVRQQVRPRQLLLTA